MDWTRMYTQAQQPSPTDFDNFVPGPYWRQLRAWIEETYGVDPLVAYSRCGGAPGWNMKYRKGGKAICTLYPDLPAGAFTCLAVVGEKDADRVEALLAACDPYLQDLYRTAGGTGGNKWLMIAVTSGRILADVEALLQLRVKPPNGRN